jgi:hypothetical protein
VFLPTSHPPENRPVKNENRADFGQFWNVCGSFQVGKSPTESTSFRSLASCLQPSSLAFSNFHAWQYRKVQSWLVIKCPHLISTGTGSARYSANQIFTDVSYAQIRVLAGVLQEPSRGTHGCSSPGDPETSQHAKPR